MACVHQKSNSSNSRTTRTSIIRSHVGSSSFRSQEMEPMLGDDAESVCVERRNSWSGRVRVVGVWCGGSKHKVRRGEFQQVRDDLRIIHRANGLGMLNHVDAAVLCGFALVEAQEMCCSELPVFHRRIWGEREGGECLAYTIR